LRREAIARDGLEVMKRRRRQKKKKKMMMMMMMMMMIFRTQLHSSDPRCLRSKAQDTRLLSHACFEKQTF
jgi:hypothetical protein